MPNEDDTSWRLRGVRNDSTGRRWILEHSEHSGARIGFLHPSAGAEGEEIRAALDEFLVDEMAVLSDAEML